MVFAMFPILALLIAGFLSLIVFAIVFAIVKKKWALLFIPLGLIVLVALATSFTIPRQVVHAPRIDPDHTHSTHNESTHISVTRNTTRSGQYNVEGNVNVTRNQPIRVHSSPKIMLAPLGLLMLLIPVGLIVLIVIAIIRKKWALILIPLGLAGLGVFVILGLKVFMGGRLDPSGPVRHEYSTNTRPAETPQPTNAAKTLPAVWSDGIEAEFQGDVYYSKKSTLRGIAGRLDKLVRQNALNGKPLPEKLAVVTYKDDFTKEILDDAVEIFQEVLPDTECYTVAAGKKPLVEDDAWISLELTESPGQPSNIILNGASVNSYLNRDDFKNGEIKAAIHIKTSRTSFSYRFTEKPWLENFSAFNNTYPRQLTVAYSQNTCRTHTEARDDALNQAHQIVSQMIHDIHGSTPASRPANAGVSFSNHDLRMHGIIVDDFAQSFRGTSTQIYRNALLLDVSPDRIMPLAQKKIRGMNIARQDWAYHIMSAIGIAVVICIIYLILNAATKGYYTVVLRTLTIIGIIAVILLLTMV